MKNDKKHLGELHTEHINWSKKLNFVKDEISSFKNRLEEVVQANTKTDVLAELEHFQNQFIRQNEVIDELLHDINSEEDKLVSSAKANIVASDHRIMDENMELVDRMKTFNKLYAELKDDFTTYLTRVM